MTVKRKNPRILIVTPETTYLPEGMGNLANYMTAKAGGLADVSAGLISALFNQGADVHVALPDYRAMFDNKLDPVLRKQRQMIRDHMPTDRVHLAEDRAFFYVNNVYSSYGWENLHMSLALQRDVMNHIVPRVKPDLIHCNDWMTALIPAMSREMEIPCLFTIHNIHTVKTSLAQIEDRGIDAAYFWDHLYYENMAETYESAREAIPVDFLTSGIFAAHFVNTVSPTFLKEIVVGYHHFVAPHIRRELSSKWYANCATGILNAPDPSYNPSSDKALVYQYDEKNHVDGKLHNKRYLQKALGLIEDDQAPLFFWPSRMDTIQKGCPLMAEILYHTIHSFWDDNLEIIFVASGGFRQHFVDIAAYHGFKDRIAVCEFDEKLSRIAFAASDFILMPSLFEPCGLPQMIAPIYGSLPVARDTGGIHDTITPLDAENDIGNGFLFETYDSGGFFWAIAQAMAFYKRPVDQRKKQIQRIMTHAAKTFNHNVTARRYIELYEKMLDRPLTHD
ncbi:MAG: glycogen synthase [Desulfobacteraceae bacterium]|nr:glycogen/starch synthase [Desulfobacteraceae bacterium]MBC2755970.1 glycogen synthase [Desulfobacteraceae bacterium]